MEGAGVVSGCADKRTPNTGADQVFATPLPPKSSRSQATPDSNASIFTTPLPSSVCISIAKLLLTNFALAVLEIDALIRGKVKLYCKFNITIHHFV